MKGSNISNLPVRSKLKTEQQVNVDIKPEDMERGILNLIDRGIVPPAAQLELKPSFELIIVLPTGYFNRPTAYTLTSLLIPLTQYQSDYTR